MNGADFLILGGGIAGLSLAARLCRLGKVVVLEGEDRLGHHSSGRSATFSHFGIGNGTVRALTASSRSFFLNPPEGLFDSQPARTAPALFVATEQMLPELDLLQAAMAPFAPGTERLGGRDLLASCPILRIGGGDLVEGILDPAGLKLDSDLLLQGFARQVRRSGGEVRLGERATTIDRAGGAWTVTSVSGESWSAAILVNAAGAWADALALLAGVRPIGLQPTRRTIIVVDPPPDEDVASWPFVKTAADMFYMLPESGRLLVSPVDETPAPPCDAQPEDLDVAVAADRFERFTRAKVGRIRSKWAGLRTFSPDRVPVAGFDPAAPGFFWLAGQGGYGLQTAPAMAQAAESLIAGGDWPLELAELGVHPAALAPARFPQS